MSEPQTDPQTAPKLPTSIASRERLLTAERFQRLSDVPPEVEWFANLRNPSTRRAYENAIRDFMQYQRLIR
jgi:integrase/recombinase XerD